MPTLELDADFSKILYEKRNGQLKAASHRLLDAQTDCGSMRDANANKNNEKPQESILAGDGIADGSKGCTVDDTDDKPNEENEFLSLFSS